MFKITVVTLEIVKNHSWIIKIVLTLTRSYWHYDVVKVNMIVKRSIVSCYYWLDKSCYTGSCVVLYDSLANLVTVQSESLIIRVQEAEPPRFQNRGKSNFKLGICDRGLTALIKSEEVLWGASQKKSIYYQRCRPVLATSIATVYSSLIDI